MGRNPVPLAVVEAKTELPGELPGGRTSLRYLEESQPVGGRLGTG
jgi:hypothetical protein